MKEEHRFREMLSSIVEIGKAQFNTLKMDEIKSFFGDMDLNESQYEHIFAYLSAHQIKVEGYVSDGNNDYKIVPREEQEPEGKEVEEEPNEEAHAISPYLKQYLKEISFIDPLKKQEELELVTQLLQGNHSVKSRLIEGKLFLVAEIAKQYGQYGMLMEDVIGEGNIGLMNGVNRIQERKEEDLNDFLIFYIKESIEAAREEAQVEKGLSGKVVERANYVHEAAKYLKEDTGQAATIKELAEYTKLTEEEIKDVLNMSGDSIKINKHSHS